MKRLATLVLAGAAIAPMAAPAAAQATCYGWTPPIPGPVFYMPSDADYIVVTLTDGTSYTLEGLSLGDMVTAPGDVSHVEKCVGSIPEPTPTPTVEPTPTEVPVTPEPEVTPTPTTRPGGPSIVVIPPTPTPTPTYQQSTATPVPTATPAATPEVPTATPTATPTTPVVTATPTPTPTEAIEIGTPTPTPTTPLADTGWNTAGLLYVGLGGVVLGAGLWALSKLERRES